MLKISQLEKQSKILKEKLPKKTIETLSFKKNKASPLLHQMQGMWSSFLQKSKEIISSQTGGIFPRVNEFLNDLSKIPALKNVSIDKFVYAAGIYNLILVLCLGLPEGTINIGVNISDHALSELIAAFLLFTAVIQIFGSRNLQIFGWTIYWEGILRLIAGFLLLLHGFFGHLGFSAGILGLIDICIGATFILQLPQATKKTHLDLIYAK